MSLVIYTDKSLFDKPNFIQNVEVGFFNCPVVEDDYTRLVLSEVDKGSYNDESTFLDRFGSKLYYSCLSTTSKCLLLIRGLPNKVINCMELGYGVGDVLLKNTSGSIYITLNRLDSLLVSIDDYPIDVILDGKHFTSYLDLCEYVSEECSK